ncbi:MAG: hypothetical protein SFU85_00260 [Candidatus Methylacidiphilales bacterium]|nr:hypothetical protein [Candidatus Methylacidiphilales bacterium]
MKDGLIFLPLFVGFSLLAAPAGAELPAGTYPGIRDSQGNLIPSAAASLGKDVRVVERQLDPELLKRRNNFGYTEDEIRTYFSKPVRMVLDETGLDKRFVKPPPPAGVHPRVIFNADDLPDLRKRLTETNAGRAAIAGIRAHLEKTITGPKAQFAQSYQSLVAGQEVEKLDSNVAYCLMYEAFRCLIDDDQEGGRKVASAITTFSKIAEKELEANLANPRNASSLKDARVISQGPTREFTLGLDYDFAYNYMTHAQRDQVRKVLVRATSGMSGIGCETLQALHAGPSNWISWGCRALFAICAIEGEPGYDPGAFKRFADAQINFINAIYPTGEAFEGWGKNFMFIEHMVILAKRGKDLNVLGHSSVRSAYHNYFIAAMSPWGNHFTFCDSMAKSGSKIARNADVLMYHTLFPGDAAGNFIYRNQISSDYENVASKTINTRHPFSTMDALCCAIFASDIADTPEAEEYALITRDRPLTYFSEDTCNLFTRSAWSKDAVYLNYLNRAIPGGHQYCDRSHFNFYGQGRFWSIYQSSRQIKEQYMPIMRSVLMVDGMGPSTAEARCVGFTDHALATFEATDLSNPWNYQTSGLEKPAGSVALTAKTKSYNFFRLTPSPLPWMDLPIGSLPDWYSSEKPGSGNHGSGETNKGDWYQRLNVKKAFRTVGLVRGPRPYGLIVDDLQIDDTPREYVWGMTMPRDVVLGSTVLTSNDKNTVAADITLRESDSPDVSLALPSDKPRSLLVRVLDVDKLEETVAKVEDVAVKNPPQPDITLNRLHLTSRSANPGFKVLLYPHREGDPLPETAWNPERTKLTIQWPDQKDTLVFSPGEDGRSRIKIQRTGGEAAEIR